MHNTNFSGKNRTINHKLKKAPIGAFSIYLKEISSYSATTSNVKLCFTPLNKFASAL